MPIYTGKPRPVDDISESEWAAYYKAKRINDTKKLRSMLPAYIKRHLASVTIKPLVIDLSQQYPPYVRAMFTRPHIGDSWNIEHFQGLGKSASNYIKTGMNRITT
jgi:hypothetical protein